VTVSVSTGPWASPAAIGVGRHPGLGGGDQPPALRLAEREGGIDQARARLHLDEGEQPFPFRDQVQLPRRRADALSQHLPPLVAQGIGGPALGVAAAEIGGLPQFAADAHPAKLARRLRRLECAPC